MNTDLSPWQKATTFYLLTLAMCVGLCVLMRDSGEAAAVVAMFTPFAGVLLMQFVLTRDGRSRAGWRPLALGRAGFRYWPLAVAMPLVVLAGSEGIVGLTGLTRADTASFPSAIDLAINFLVLVGFCFFEELGWRGYLQPLVGQVVGKGLRSGLLVGFLHGLWHLPIVFLVAGAYLTEGNRWLTVPIFLGVLTSAGALYAWLRERSGSVWPAVITHAAFNLFVGVVADAFVTSDPDRVALIGRETGVATLGMLVLAVVVFYASPVLPGRSGRVIVPHAQPAEDRQPGALVRP